MPSSTEWNARYANKAVWSGNVNSTLVACAASLAPGTALDVGCGEGADAVWLASQGWRVRGVDFSREALARAADAAEDNNVGPRCEWIQADLSVWTTNRAYDLVTCHFLHEEVAVRGRAWRSAVAAVAPGGTLLIVGHSPRESEDVPGPPFAARFSAEEVVAELALSSQWEVKATDSIRAVSDAHLVANSTTPLRRDVVFTAKRIGH